MSKIFLASRYERYVEMQGFAQLLEQDGHQIVSSWISGNTVPYPEDMVKYDEKGFSDEHCQYATKMAELDLNDLMSADTIISFTENPVEGYVRGARHVEQGFAMGINLAINFIIQAMGVPGPAIFQMGFLPKRLVVVGFRENIYHTLPGVEFHQTFEAMREALKPKPDLAVVKPQIQVVQSLEQAGKLAHGQQTPSGLQIATR